MDVGVNNNKFKNKNTFFDYNWFLFYYSSLQKFYYIKNYSSIQNDISILFSNLLLNGIITTNKSDFSVFCYEPNFLKNNFNYFSTFTLLPVVQRYMLDCYG